MRFQFSLRNTILVTAVVALALGLHFSTYASLGKIEQQARYELGPFGPIAVGDELNSSGSTSTAYYICPCVVGVEMSFDGMIGATYYYFTCFGVTWRLPMEGRTWIAQLEVIEVDLTKKE